MIGREQMIALNCRQGDFYDKVWAGEDAAAQKGVGSGYSENETINWISRIWATMRNAHFRRRNVPASAPAFVGCKRPGWQRSRGKASSRSAASAEAARPSI